MPTDKELREAALLLERKPSIANKYDNAAVKVARAYLAEHRADDDEPVTEEWLRGIGFENSAGRLLLGKIQFTFFEGWNAWWSFSDGRGATRLIDDVKTRGSVRRLCRALGITLKENSP